MCTHILIVHRKVVGHTNSVEVERHMALGMVECYMVPVMVDMPHTGVVEVEHRKGPAEVERHMGLGVVHTQSMGPGWGSDSYYFSLLNLILKHVLYRPYE